MSASSSYKLVYWCLWWQIIDDNYDDVIDDNIDNSIDDDIEGYV